jgi:hypothetical protein
MNVIMTFQTERHEVVQIIRSTLRLKHNMVRRQCVASITAPAMPVVAPIHCGFVVLIDSQFFEGSLVAPVLHFYTP